MKQTPVKNTLWNRMHEMIGENEGDHFILKSFKKLHEVLVRVEINEIYNCLS